MKAINVGNLEKGQIIKKTLVNRSRSGNFAIASSRIASPRSNISPFRNCIGLKNIQEVSSKKQKDSQFALNYDYFQVKEELKGRTKNDRKDCKLTNLKAPKNLKEMNLKQEAFDQSREKYNSISQKQTNQNSKLSQDSSNRQFIHSQYMVCGYLSPRSKLSNLEKDKKTHRNWYYDNLERVLKKEQEIKQSRSKYKLQSQIYQNIISKLKKQANLAKSQLFIDSKLQQLRQSGKSTETSEGESSNQY